LRYAKESGEAKERPAAGAITGRFGPRNEGNDRVVEPEDADLAQKVGRSPCDGKSA
jgi:hypothetical protein